jgi:hypothetical protein
MKADTLTLEPRGAEVDHLLKLEILIAQRADELWMRSGSTRGTDLIHWIQAEREVFGRYIGLGKARKPLAASHS